MWGDIERILNQFWNNLSPHEKSEIESVTGFKWNSSSANVYYKLASLQTYVDYAQQQRQFRHERQKIQDFLGGLESIATKAVGIQAEAMKEIERERQQQLNKLVEGLLNPFYKMVQQMLGTVARRIDYNEKRVIDITAEVTRLKSEDSHLARRLGEELDNVKGQLSKYEGDLSTYKKKLKEETPKMLAPRLISYGHCVLAKGANNFIMTIPKEDGDYLQCNAAAAAHSRGRFDFQIFHSPLLQQAGCPLYTSRNISRRFPIIGWLVYRPQVCYLADGQEHIKRSRAW